MTNSPTPSAQTVTADDKHWALLYLHDWDPPKEGQEHKWEPGKNVFPEISGVFGTWSDATAARTAKSDAEKYWICRVRFTPKQIATLTTELAAASARIGELREALRFYADGKRYNGPNQRKVDNDPWTKDDAAYMKDVTRDGGSIARAALSQTEEGRSDRPIIDHYGSRTT